MSDAKLSERPGAVAAGVTQVVNWIDARMPLVETYEYHLSRYWAPKNFNVCISLAYCPWWCWSISSSRGSGSP